MPLDAWQEMKKLPGDKLAQHISLISDNVACDGQLLISELLIEVFEKIRGYFGKSIHINSGYRTAEKQKSLIEQGYKAAKVSPHCRGFAFDLDASRDAETLLDICRVVSKEYGRVIRIGWKSYWDAGQKFIHIDVAPAAYLAAQYQDDGAFPEAWKTKGAEW